MVYYLICEGRCNPGIAEVNRHIREFSSARYYQRIPYDGTQRMLVAQAALRHTEHTLMLDGASAACDDCGHTRQYGNRTLGGALYGSFDAATC